MPFPASDDALSASKALHTSPAALCTAGVCAERCAPVWLLPLGTALPESDALDSADREPAPLLLPESLPVADADEPPRASAREAEPPESRLAAPELEPLELCTGLLDCVVPVDLCVVPVDLCTEPLDCVVPVDLWADPLDCQFMLWLELWIGAELAPAEPDPAEPDPAEPDPPLGGAVVPEPDPPLPGVDVLPLLPLDDGCGVSLAGADGLLQP